MTNYEEYTVRVYEDRTEWLNSNGQRHRIDGPAVECANGSKFWYLNGQLHRVDGPAIEWANGSKEWYLNGKRFTEEDYNKKIKEMRGSCDGRVVEIDGKKYKLTEI